MVIGIGCHAHETIRNMSQLSAITTRHGRKAIRYGTNTVADGRLIGQAGTTDLRTREDMVRRMLLHTMHRWSGVELGWSAILGMSVGRATVIRVRDAPRIRHGSCRYVMTGPVWKHGEVRMAIAASASIGLYMFTLQLALNALAVWSVTNERQNRANAFNELHTKSSI